MIGQFEQLGGVDETYPEIENLQEGLAFPMDLSSQLSSGGHDNGHGTLHLFQRTLIFDMSEKRK